MKSYRLAFALSVIGLAILTVGCSSNETKTAPEKEAVTKPQKVEPTLYTGQEAFNRMLGLALKWAPDAQPARVESVLTTETTGQDGKSSIWRGYFASPSRRATKTIVCSGSRQPGSPPFGVSPEGAEGAYNAQSASLVFSQYLLKADTDKAFDGRTATRGRCHREEGRTAAHYLCVAQGPEAERARLVCDLRCQ